MILRPLDASGDILPVLSLNDTLTGAAAIARLAAHRLQLLAGEWWEKPRHGNEVLDMLASRMSASDLPAFSSYISTYILQTSGVVDIRDVSCTLSGRTASFQCTLVTESGEETLEYAGGTP